MFFFFLISGRRCDVLNTHRVGDVYISIYLYAILAILGDHIGVLGIDARISVFRCI